MNVSDNYMKFADENMLLHHRPNPTTHTSENELLFTAEYLILNKSKNSMIVSKMYNFYQSEVNKGHKISHDNKTGMVAMYPDLDESIFRVGGRIWLHPRDWVFYGYQKHGWPFYPLLPLVSIANIISCARTWKKHPDSSCARTWKKHPDRKELTTSGKLLAMVRNLSAGMRLTQWICTKLIKNNEHFGSWENVARIYFPNQEGLEHPIVTSIKALDER
jgi:hypothetical protein